MADRAGGRLTGLQVLVPRGGEWGEKVARLVAAEGGTAVVVPLIGFEPAPDPEALDDAVRRLAAGRYRWLMVTSATTVAALAERAAAVVGGSPVDALTHALGGAQVAAVGPGTGAALARAGVRPALVPTGERSARGLVAEMPPPTPGTAGPVLAPHSDLAEPTLVDGLRAAGWEVDEVIAYRTVVRPPLDTELGPRWRDGAFDAVLLSSASTVTAVTTLLGPPAPGTVLCCIGPRTTQAAQDAGLHVDVQAAQASAEELVTALARHRADRADSAQHHAPHPSQETR